MSTTERAPQTPAAAIPRTLGDRLAKARKMADLNYVQMHEKTGMARNSMPRYEADETPARPHTIMAYAMATHKAFGLEPYEVFAWLVYGDSTHDIPADSASDLPGDASSRTVAYLPLRILPTAA